MTVPPSNKLHWTQRVALVRHNLHEARLTGDFTFFKTLQAHVLIDGTDYVAILNSVLANEADTVLSTLDNLNAGIAYVHQDAFKAVYDGAKAAMYKAGNSIESRKSLLRVDASQQREMADHAIDKTANSAIQLIEAQPIHCQDAVASAWITGATIIADAVSVCLKEMDAIEAYMDDFIRLEYSWNRTQTSVDAAISALRGIFNLMAGGGTNTSGNSINTMRNISRNNSVSSNFSEGTPRSPSSTASAFGMIKRALSNAHMLPPPRMSRNSSIADPHHRLGSGVDSSPRGLRQSISNACPTRMPHSHDIAAHRLSTIPHTPAATESPIVANMSPFRGKNDYFSFDDDSNSKVDADTKSDGFREEAMQLESLDPLYTETLEETNAMPAPLTLRRLSEAFGVSVPTPIAA